jgi:alpha-L-rhamnosidase
MGDTSAGSCTSEVSLVNTALSYLQASDVAKAAVALGHADDAAHYRQVAGDIDEAFNARFLNAAGDTYGDGRQVTSVLPLALGMVPAKNLRAVGAQFAYTVLHKDAGHLDTGIFGTRYLMDALSAIGRTDIAMTVLEQKTYPGFGFEIAQGATSSWEEWTYRSSIETHDHAMSAGIKASFTAVLGGISPASPGYGSVLIDPRAPAGLRGVAASVDTVHGTVATSWTRTGKRFAMTVTVPVGVTATVHVPVTGRTATGTATRGARTVRHGGTASVYSVGSGTWHFTG